MTPQEAAEQYGESFKTGEFFERIRIDAFISGAKWQSEQDNQALSSALKEIAELHAKVNRLLRSIDELEDDNTDLEDSCIRLKAEVIKLQNADRLSPESTRQPDSANLPPEVTS